MKNIFYFLLCTFLTVNVISCIPEETNPTKKLAKYSINSKDGEEIIYKFSYDNQERISFIKTTVKSNESIPIDVFNYAFHYNDNNQIVELDELSDDEIHNKVQFEYKKDLITSTRLVISHNVFVYVYYAYDKNKYLTKTYSDIELNEPIIKHQFEEGNLKEILIKEYAPIPDYKPEFIVESSYAFDDKKNPFKAVFPEAFGKILCNPLNHHINPAPSFFEQSELTPLFVNTNNMTKWYHSRHKVELSIEYIYDKEGYPTMGQIVSDSEIVGTLNFEYFTD